MIETPIVHSLFLVFAGAAFLATVALFTRQSLLLAYIAVGVVLGPSALNLVSNPELIAEISNIGILFLLFLLGLNLELKELQSLFREAISVTALTCSSFFIVGAGLALLMGFVLSDSLLIGVCMMFSSTIIALKLLPTSALHHQRMGELIVSVLLLQDILAIIILIGLNAFADATSLASESAVLLVGLPALALGAWWVSTHVLVRLYALFDQIHEYLFLIAIAWCLGLSELAAWLGLSHEVGAFIAGVTLASSPVARFMAESLKPLRDFFLVLFFFALGAGLDLHSLPFVWFPALVFAVVAVFLKPYPFTWLLQKTNSKKMAGETGARLSQISEFSLLILFVAAEHSLVSSKASLTIQTATILSFIFSSFWIVRRYPTPIAAEPTLRRD